jgi:hypothetical protein
VYLSGSYSGATKASKTSRDPIPPSVVRLKIVTSAGQQAYLAIDATDSVLKFFSPGSAVVSSENSLNPIVWVLDANLWVESTTRRPSLEGSSSLAPAESRLLA